MVISASVRIITLLVDITYCMLLVHSVCHVIYVNIATPATLDAAVLLDGVLHR